MNLRPSGYEPDELPGCSTPRHHGGLLWGKPLEPGRLRKAEGPFCAMLGAKAGATDVAGTGWADKDM